MARANNVRLQLFLPRPLAERLDAVASGPGVSRSAILVEALTHFLERKGDDTLELRFAQRLDKISNQLARIERNDQILSESLALFIRYMLTVIGPLPEGDEAGRALGRDRFRAFVERVTKKLASGHLTFDLETVQ